MDFMIRKSSILQIQIDEVDSENENDNSYFNEHVNERRMQQPNSTKSMHSKTFDYEEQLGESQQLATTKKNNNNAKETAFGIDHDFDIIQPENDNNYQ